MEQETELIQEETMQTKKDYCIVCKCEQVFVESEFPKGYLICTAGCGFRKKDERINL